MGCLSRSTVIANGAHINRIELVNWVAENQRDTSPVSNCFNYHFDILVCINWTCTNPTLCASIALESWIAFNNSSKNAFEFQELHFGQFRRMLKQFRSCFLSLLLVVLRYPSAFRQAQRRVITTMNSIINHFIIFISFIFFLLFGNYRNIKKSRANLWHRKYSNRGDNSLVLLLKWHR